MKKQLCLIGAVVALIWVANALPDTLNITEHQITSTASYETTPSLGVDGTGDYVSFTSREMLNNGFFDQGDIWLRRLNPDGSPAGAATAIISDPTDDKLNDGYGDYIVFTSYDSTMTSTGTIMLYQLSTGLLQPLSGPLVIQEPRIHGDTVVWVQGSVGASEVMRYDLAWLGTANLPVPVTGPVPSAFNVDIGDRFIVWVESSGDYDIGAYDMQDGIRIKLTDTNLIDERHPSTSGDWIAWESRDAGATHKRIEAVNLQTGDYRIVSDTGAVASRPSIDGDLIAWESDETGDYEVFVYRLSTRETFAVTMDPDDQYLNDLFGEKVAYVEYREGDENVYVAHLTFVPDDPCASAGGDSDSDGVCDHNDNCPSIANPGQSDSDQDGVGDACDACPLDFNNDSDGDGSCDSDDLCLGNDSSGDTDTDGLCDDSDPCIGSSNTDQDNDGYCDDGDLCLGNDASGDSDGDGVCDDLDACQGDDATGDTDGDLFCDDIDACVLDIENDVDADGICETDDNCDLVYNPDQADLDIDGIGDACDTDSDNDGVDNDVDNCPLHPNADQADFDDDGEGDACDQDIDGDGVLDAADACLATTPGSVVNGDGCSIDDLCPCQNNWKNHGAFVKCVAHSANDFVDLQLISLTEHEEIVSQAAESACGQKK